MIKFRMTVEVMADVVTVFEIFTIFYSLDCHKPRGLVLPTPAPSLITNHSGVNPPTRSASQKSNILSN
jgi:hypothetical protein